jgi:hypothetical protein
VAKKCTEKQQNPFKRQDVADQMQQMFALMDGQAEQHNQQMFMLA